jgi:hypothetical protein
MLKGSRLLVASLLSPLIVGCGHPPGVAPTGDPAKTSAHPPPAAAEGLQLSSPEITLAPGEEVFKCWYTSLPTAEVAIADFESWMSQGSHHFIVYTTEEAMRPDGTMEDCAGGLGGAGLGNVPVWLYSTQDPHGTLTTPEGVAMPLKAQQPLLFNMHYINTTQAPVTVQVWLNLKYASGSFQRAGAFVTFNTQIAIPPGGTQTVSGDCAVPGGAQFFLLSTHSHKHTVDARASRFADGKLGETLVDTTDWEHATIARFAAPSFLTFAHGEQLHYQCSYQNDTQQTITVGQSALTNEMCMAVGYYFPSTRTSLCLNSTSY